MGTIIELRGQELKSLLLSLGVDPRKADSIWDMRVAIDGGFKVSVNRGVWSPPMGQEYK